MLYRLVNIWGRIYFGKLSWHKSHAAKQTVIPDLVTPDFPPAFLTDGNKGSFEAQNRKLAKVLRANNVPVKELYFPKDDGEVPHEYLFHPDDPLAQKALAEIIDFTNEYAK